MLVAMTFNHTLIQHEKFINLFFKHYLECAERAEKNRGKNLFPKSLPRISLIISIFQVILQQLPGRQQGIPYFIGDSRSCCKPFVNSLLFLSFPLFSFSTLQRYKQ